MGIAKTLWLDSQERGWDAPEKHVCVDCVVDLHLKTTVQENLEQEICDYCGAESKDGLIAAPVAAIMEPISRALMANFADPSSAGLPRDSGEWIDEASITDTSDALLSLPLECHDELFEDISDAFHNTAWYPCTGGHWLDVSLDKELRYSWEHFVDVVKHESRFFFITQEKKDPLDREALTPLDFLKQIGEMSKNLGLVQVIPSGVRLYRVRNKKLGKIFKTFEDMGPPPPLMATAGRMNPPGISYMYVAFDSDTAVAEIVDKPPAQIAVAEFKCKTALQILDLTKIPDVPSVFEENEFHERETILFFLDFIEAITNPIERDGREHIDYVPSQVVSEYFAQLFRTEDDAPLDGIAYPSVAMPSGRNLVLFPPRGYERKLEDMLELISVKRATIKILPEGHRLLKKAAGRTLLA